MNKIDNKSTWFTNTEVGKYMLEDIGTELTATSCQTY